MLPGKRGNIYPEVRIRLMIKKGRPVLLVSKFVLENHRREISTTNQVYSANSFSLIGRYPEERLYVHMLVNSNVGEIVY